MKKRKQTIEKSTILFAGDSGDGIQSIGDQMSQTAAISGNDVATFPDYPSEIRAPVGTVAGISGFQVRFADRDIHTSSDVVDVLVAMNPAALNAKIAELKPNGILIVNTDSFSEKSLHLAGYSSNPLEDGSLDGYQVFPVELTRLTRSALAETSLTQRDKDRGKNFFALGVVFWLYNRSLEYTLQWIEQKFARKPQYIESNTLALRGGYAYCDAAELFATSYEIKPTDFLPGKYRNVTGNRAVALGLVAASHSAGLPLVYGSYPITPASDILHELVNFKHCDVKTLQMEDEIAAIGAAIGASYSGAIGVTGSSGPGLALKAEALNLAVMAELPLVVCNVQRGGPSTGMPTKTEQSDLLQMLFGRNGESPVPVFACSRPSDCFEVAYEATRYAIRYMTPVIVLSDAYIANSSEPWRIPEAKELSPIPVDFAHDADVFAPYLRDPMTLSRPWAIPGTPGLEHRVGGLEKEHITGNVSYDPENHERMTHLRAMKIQRMAEEFPPTEIFGEQSGDLLVLSWGGTFGVLREAVENTRRNGADVSHIHLRYLNPLPEDLEGILKRFKQVLIPELNLGQLLQIIRAKYLVDAVGLNKMQGQPFQAHEVELRIGGMLK